MSASSRDVRSRRILVVLADAETVAASLDCARAAALSHDDAITAIHAAFVEAGGAISDEDVDIEGLRNLVAGDTGERQRLIRAAFEAWRAATPAAGGVAWRDCPADIVTCLEEEAAAADLIVVGRPVRLDSRNALHAALFRSGCLVLVAPERVGAGAVIGRHILIGWKPGRHAERAVEAALPWLRAAERVTVACVEEGDGDAYAADAAAFLGRLSLPFTVKGIAKGAESVAEQLLGAARSEGADSILIGAYAHGELWEAMLGGVTRDMLAGAELPVFLMR